MQYNELDPVLHSALRLSIVSTLVATHEADFNTVKATTGATAGNLSMHIRKLQDAGYIEVIKGFKDNYQHTLLRLTPAGLKAFEEYVAVLRKCLNLEVKTQSSGNDDASLPDIQTSPI